MTKGIEIPVAIGELIDKISILEIKIDRFADVIKTRNARTELDLLVGCRDRSIAPSETLSALSSRLKEVNGRIWDLEDAIRDCERRSDFGVAFVTVARRIYHANDERAAIKREINLVAGSNLIEEKSYAPY